MGNRFIQIAIGILIFLAVLTPVVDAVTGLTGPSGALEDTPAGGLLSVLPIVFVAGAIGFAWYDSKRK